MLQNLRAFFAARDVLEVETPLMSRAAITDPHLHSFRTGFNSEDLYLQTSPEFFMKRMLAAHGRDIYQICKVFRDDELGRYHSPEFSMLEWYRIGFDDRRLMDETEQLLQQLFAELAPQKALQASRRISYRQAFIDALGIDPLQTDVARLRTVMKKRRLEIPQGMDEEDLDMWLDWLLSRYVISTFPIDAITFLYDYPASQAALARINEEDPRLAHRFEVFVGPLELANGFYELGDAPQQAARFAAENQRRRELGVAEMPVDELLLQALASGLPDCAGIALGLDRLLMLLTNADSLAAVMSFDFSRV